MIYRRDQIRQGTFERLAPEFFEGQIVPHEGYDPDGMRPPTVAVAVRPRRVANLIFDFDAELDAQLEELAFKHYLLKVYEGYKASQGYVSLELPGEGPPRQRVEIHQNGVILGARALRTRSLANDAPLDDTGENRSLRFHDILELVLNVPHFAAAAYALKKPGIEMDVLVGFLECQGYWTYLKPPRSESYTGMMSSNQTSSPVSLVVARSDAKGKIHEASFLALARETSRAFGTRAPEDALKWYARR
jgi:hypothetical protein